MSARHQGRAQEPLRLQGTQGKARVEKRTRGFLGKCRALHGGGSERPGCLDAHGYSNRLGALE